MQIFEIEAYSSIDNVEIKNMLLFLSFVQGLVAMSNSENVYQQRIIALFRERVNLPKRLGFVFGYALNLNHLNMPNSLP
jgi:hypothetical protein